MNWQDFPHLIPYIISFLISLNVSILVYRQRRITGARVFSGIALSQALWTLGFIFELTAPTMEGKIFWDDFQWLVGLGWYFGFLIFSVQYSGREYKKPRLTWALFSVIPIIFILLVITNGYTHLIRDKAWLVQGEPFSILEYDFTPLVLVFSGIFYLFFFLGLFYLIQKLFKSQKFQKQQIWIILIGTLIPLLGTFLTLGGVRLGLNRDLTPFTFAISNLLILYGLTRFRPFSIQPLAGRFVMNNMVDPVIILDDQNCVVDQNPAAQKLTGAPIAEIFGQPASKVFSSCPELAEKFQGTEQFLSELVVQVKEDNRGKEFKAIVSPLRNRTGRKLGGIILAREITPLDKVEVALHEEEEKYRRLVELTHDWVWMVDTESNLIYSNQAIEELLGYRVDELLGKPVIHLMESERQDEIWAFMANAIREKTGWSGLGIRWQHKDGSYRVFEGSSQPILDSDGNVIGFSGFDHDVTERYEMAEKLQQSKLELEKKIIERTQALYQSEEQYRSVVENADEGIFILDGEKILFVNPKAIEITGFSERELLGMKLVDIIHPKDHSILEEASRFIRGESSITDVGLFRMIDKQQEIRWVESKSDLITWGDKTVILSLVSDVTERVMAVEAEHKARLTAETMQAANLALTKSLDMDRVLETLLDVIADLIPYSSANLYLYEDEKYLISRASRGSEDFIKGQYFDIRAFEAGRLPIFSKIIETQESILIPDISITDWASQPETTHLNSWIGTPLISGGEIIGFLSLNHIEPNFYTEEHKTLAEMVALQATIAIRNATLFEQTIQRTKELEDITDLSSALRLANRQDEMFNVLLTKASVTLQSDAGAVFLLEDDSLQCTSTYGSQNTCENIIHHAPTMELIWEVAHSPEPLFLTEQPSDSRYEENISSLALLPIKTSEGIIGVMLLSWIEPEKFSSSTKKLLKAFVDIVGNSLERARILETLEQQVANRTRDLSVLYQVTSVVSAYYDLESITTNALEEILQAVNGNSGTIHFWSPDESNFRLISQLGIPENLLEGLSALPIGGQFIGEIIGSNQPLVIMDYQHDPRVPEALNSLDCQVYIGAPIRIRGQIRGVLSVYLETAQQYTTDNVRLLMMVVDQLGIALERGQLQEQAEEAIVMEERHRLARELHDAVTQSLYSLTLMADAARKFNDQTMWARSEHYLRLVQSTAKEVLKEMRLLVFELRPTVLEDEGFVNALRQRLETVEARAGVETSFDIEEHSTPPIDIQVALYRIAQEALNNALKHSQATSVAIKYFTSSDRVSLSISDNGHGFDPNQIRGGIGMKSMRERVEKLGGVFSVVSDEKAGTSINVIIEELE